MFDLIGKTVGSYRILEQAGSGGMATVYKAYQPNMDRYVAIKVLPIHLSNDSEFAKRFQREARAIARLEHSHILPVYDYGEYEGITYIAMRYIKAGTLKDRMSTGRLPLDEINHLISQIGSALDYAHRMGVIHRDVKPANVLIDDQGDVYLSDFGLARMMEPTQQLTASGVGLGTPAYMSPEQGQGIKVDHRSDIYSLGIILYEMLTGRVPYEAETPMAVVFKHIHGDLTLPHIINPNTPEPVERVVLKALAKNPADRYQTAGEMVQALNFAVRTMSTEVQQQIMAEEVASVQLQQDVSIITKIQRIWDQPRGRLLIAGGALAVILLLGFLLIQLPGNITILAPNATHQSTSVAVGPTGALTVSSLPAPQGELVFEEDFEDDVANVTYIGADDSSWQIVDDGTDHKVFELNNASSTWVGAGFGPSAFTDGAVEYRVKLIDYDLSSDTGSGIATISFRDTPSERYIFALMPFPKRTQLSYADQTTGWIPIDGGFTAYNFEKNTWYTVRLDIQGSKITVYLNGILTSSVEDSRVTIGGLGFSLGPNTVAYFDDIRVYSMAPSASTLTSTPLAFSTQLLATPTLNPMAEQVRAFAEPILQTIADRPPDFEDDFSTAEKGWKSWGDPNLEQIAIENGRLRITVGGLRQLTHVINPAVNFDNFVLMVDAITEVQGAHDSPQISWRGGTFVLYTSQYSWETRYCGSTSCDPNYASGLDEGIAVGKVMQVMIIARGSAFALYLNGNPLAYVDDPTRPPGTLITLAAFSGSESRATVIAFDNFKIWDISDLP